MIEKEIRRFYKNLYAKTPTLADKQDIYKFIGKSKLKTLTQEEYRGLRRVLMRVRLVNFLRLLEIMWHLMHFDSLVLSTKYFGNC